MPNQGFFLKKNIASFTLIFMSVQLMGIEGFQISMPKVVYMCISPLLLLALSPKMSKAILLSVLFWSTTVLLQIIQYDNVRMSTFYYTAMFLSVFCFYYNLVWEEHCFDVDDFLRVIKIVIFSYAICLLLQQGAMLLGRRRFVMINLMGLHWQQLFRLNSLALEPSHAARILSVYFYAFLKITEIKNGRPLSIYEFFLYHQWTITAFLYTMIAIGSGTAMVGLAILSLYFIKKQYVILIVISFFLLYYFAPNINYDPLNRAMLTFDAVTTLDESEIQEADASASGRVNAILSIFKYTDLTDFQLWLGYGEGSSLYARGPIPYYPIYEYGLLSYLLKLLLFFSCSICGIFSLSTIMYMILLNMFVGNVAYAFACLMVFSGVKYFQTLYTKR